MDKGKIRRALIATLVLVMAFGLIASPVAAQPPEMVKVLIGFDRQPGPAEEAVVRGAGGSIKYTYHLVPAIAASVPEAAIQGLLRNPKVTSVEPDITVYAIDTELDITWGVKRIGAGVVHDGGNKGAGVKVAVIDSGVDYTHPDLDANFDPDLRGYDFVNNGDDPMDNDGHGTHVAGTIAAEDNTIGVVGVAPEVQLYALKVLEGGSGSYSDVIAAIEWAVDNGIQVTNNSYGSSGDPGATVKAAFDNAYAAGVIHVAAAGNAGNPPGKGDNVIYPARWDSVIAVAATDQSDSRPKWSSTGPDVELAAPGVSINSTLRTGGYGEYSGTSMASPHVAGTAALVIATGITDANDNGRINDEVRLRLQQTADDLGDPGRDSRYGYGLVNVAAAVATVAPPLMGIISGTVTDSDTTLSPIAGASVTDGTRSTITDINGAYTFTDVPEGTYTVTASAAGYNSASQTGVVVTADTTTVDFALNPIPPIPVGSIGGRVTNADDLTAISEATVSVDTGQSATTDSNGEYTITGVPTGDRSVTASADGFESQTKPAATVTESDTTTVDFSLNPVTTASTVSVASVTYTTEGGKNKDKHLLITVALLDDRGNPVSGASVSIDLHRDGDLDARGTGTTGTDGTVTFSRKNAKSGIYTTIVTGVTAGLTWDGVTPPNELDK